VTDDNTMANVKGGAAVGGAFGGILGALIGWIIASAPDPVPVIGPVVGQGVISTALVGLLAGAAIGALAGALFGAFSPTARQETASYATEESHVLFPLSPLPEAELEAETPVNSQEPEAVIVGDDAPAALEVVEPVALSSVGEAEPIGEVEPPAEIEPEGTSIDAANVDAVASPTTGAESISMPKVRRARRVAPRYQPPAPTDETPGE
jgi:hypothetical protein